MLRNIGNHNNIRNKGDSDSDNGIGDSNMCLTALTLVHNVCNLKDQTSEPSDQLSVVDIKATVDGDKSDNRTRRIVTATAIATIKKDV